MTPIQRKDHLDTFAITLLVYGVVGLIVKMDDFGLQLTMTDSTPRQRIGRMLVAGPGTVIHVEPNGGDRILI